MTNLQEAAWKNQRHGRGWIETTVVEGDYFEREDRGGYYRYSRFDDGEEVPVCSLCATELDEMIDGEGFDSLDHGGEWIDSTSPHPVCKACAQKQWDEAKADALGDHINEQVDRARGKHD
jgi:hypothetical protein